MTKIMLVDDEESIRGVVERIVRKAGYEFCYTMDGAQAVTAFFEEKPSLLLLDVMLPGVDGFEICAELRERGVLEPVIFLSAKGDIVDKRTGFRSGGDDYLVKPFSPEELVLRIEAHLRRHERLELVHPDNLVAGPFEFDAKRHTVLLKGEEISLTNKEFSILYLMASHPGEVFTREQLVAEIWGKDYVGEITSVSVFMRKIRNKIEAEPSHPVYLETVWGVGYCLNCGSKDSA